VSLAVPRAGAPVMGLGFGLGLVAVVVLLILYGSLFPFRLQPLPPGRSLPMEMIRLLADAGPSSRGDMLANLMLYLPLGGTLALALLGRVPAGLALLAATLVGFVLSFGVETMQLMLAGRSSHGGDVVLNTAGSALGALVAQRIGRWRPAAGGVAAEPFALLLLAAWIGLRLYPYVPTIDWQSWKNALKPLLLEPVFEPVRCLRLAGFWLLAAELVAVVARGRLPAWLAVPAVLFGTLAAKVVIVGNSVTFSEAVAVLVALVGWALLQGLGDRPRMLFLLALVLVATLADRLEPYYLGPAREFGWIPFRSFLLGGGWGAGIQSGLQKFYFYGGLIWLAVRAGLALPRATAAVTLLALALSIVQIWLPGRSAEITDALLALLAAGTLAVLRRTHPA